MASECSPRHGSSEMRLSLARCRKALRKSPPGISLGGGVLKQRPQFNQPDSKIMTNQTPETYEDLIQVSDAHRPQIVKLANGLRWCWIAEWRSDRAICQFGFKIEGQTIWHPIGCLGRENCTWVRRLNEREGMTPDARIEICRTARQEAKACLSEDETEVGLLLSGTLSQYDHETGCHVFELESDIATDLFSSIASILERLNATPTQRTVATSQGPHCKMNADEDVTFCVPGRHEVDTLDPGRFSLTIDIQSAAALYSQVSFIFQRRGNGDAAAGGN